MSFLTTEKKEDMGNADEQRYYAYAAARYGAYENIMWDIAHEYNFMTEQQTIPYQYRI
jgi:hypothetical protein